MKATFTNAVVYTAEAVCASPFRTGDSAGGTETVLRRKDGTALLPGTSLAGALRARLEERKGRDAANVLFGSQEKAGRLIVSDGVFEREDQTIRPRLRIDGRTGTALPGGKFDLAHLETGSRFRFTVTWLGDAPEGDLEEIEALLSELNAGTVRLGAQKSNGFGAVRLETVKKRTFDLMKAEDRADWLAGNTEGAPLTLKAVPDSGDVAVFTLEGQADRVLIKDSLSDYNKEKQETYTVNLKEAGRPVLPGSSVKGAVRARAEAVAALLGLPGETAEELFGREARTGDNGKAGRVRFDEVVLDPGKKCKVHRIRIDRFTGGVMRGGLFIEEEVSGPVTLRVIASGADEAGCALLLYALRDLGLGLYNLGSGGAVGRGFLTVSKIGVRAAGGTGVLRFDGDRVCTAEDPDGLFDRWLNALTARRDAT